MAWVRYDDQFHNNPKVTAVIAEDPGAIALHALGNTWTNAQKRPGFIPSHQPGILICDKPTGSAWAALLVKHGLWHRIDSMCPDCMEDYADLPEGADGFVVHHGSEYRAPARDKTTPGTPADLSEKRRAAGSKGGKSSAKRREQIKQDTQANQANGASKNSKSSSKRASPVPVPTVASNEATVPIPSESGADRPRPGQPQQANRQAKSRAAHGNAGDVIAAYVDGSREAGLPTPAESLRARVGKQARELLGQDIPIEDLVAAGRHMGAVGWNDLAVQVQRDAANARASPGKSEGHKPYQNPDDQSVYDEDYR